MSGSSKVCIRGMGERQGEGGIKVSVREMLESPSSKSIAESALHVCKNQY